MTKLEKRAWKLFRDAGHDGGACKKWSDVPKDMQYCYLKCAEAGPHNATTVSVLGSEIDVIWGPTHHIEASDFSGPEIRWFVPMKGRVTLNMARKFRDALDRAIVILIEHTRCEEKRAWADEDGTPQWFSCNYDKGHKGGHRGVLITKKAVDARPALMWPRGTPQPTWNGFDGKNYKEPSDD